MIIPLTDIDIRLVPGAWPISAAMRADAARHWLEAVAANPNLWDGRILGMEAPGQPGGIAIADGVLRARAHEDAYSISLAWRAWGFPEIGIRNLFGAALILSADNALIFGVMAGWTAVAGQVYPPAGSLEPRDVRPDRMVDVLGSIETELHEETGLFASEAAVGEIMAVFDGPRVAIVRVFRFPEAADALAARIRANLDAQELRELEDVVVLRGIGDLQAAGPHPPYAAAVVRHLLG